MTITETRYGGAYEGGKWAAFDLWHDEIPADAFGSDTECATWWEDYGAGVGIGDTPQEALEALLANPCPLRRVLTTYGFFPRTATRHD